MTDPQLRQVLYPWWVCRHPRSLLVQEYGGLWAAVADVAAFEVHDFWGYEIKSDHDSLRRLPGQLAAYATFFHRVTLITGDRYAAKVEALAPEWAGLVVVDTDGLITERRTEQLNPDAPLTAQALWIEEGRTLCREQRLRRYSHLNSWTLPRFLHDNLPAEVIERWVLTCLRRRYTQPFGSTVPA